MNQLIKQKNTSTIVRSIMLFRYIKTEFGKSKLQKLFYGKFLIFWVLELRILDLVQKLTYSILHQLASIILWFCEWKLSHHQLEVCKTNRYWAPYLASALTCKTSPPINQWYHRGHQEFRTNVTFDNYGRLINQ